MAVDQSLVGNYVLVIYSRQNYHVCWKSYSQGKGLCLICLPLCTGCIPPFLYFDKPNKTFVLFLFAFGAILPQKLRVINNWLMIFLNGAEQQASPEGGWEWNGIKTPFKTDFEWFKNFKPVNQNDILISTYFKSGTTWHQVKFS